MDRGQIDLLERLVVGSVAITERAIAAAGTDLTFVQWRVLLIVGEQPAGATVGEIAGRIGARGSPASRLISRLKGRGVVRAERDRRTVGWYGSGSRRAAASCGAGSSNTAAVILIVASPPPRP